MAIQKITVPVGNATDTISVLPEHTLQLDFDTDNASVDRSGNNLTINFNDGGTVVVSDFFVTEGEELPMFVLPDGTEISSAELLQNMNPGLDLTTAAGPSASRADGSGAGEYGDGSGELLGGLDRLGSLGTFQWGREIEFSDTGIMPVSALDAALQPEAPGLEGLPEDLPEELPEGGPNPNPVENLGYMSRAVVYASAKQENNSAVFRLLDENGNSITDLSSVNYHIQGVENGHFALPPVVNADGSLVLPLSDAGFQALQDTGENVYDLVTVVVDGKSYLMQIVISPDGNFNSADEDALLAAQGIEGSTMYEWHIELGGSSTTGDRVAAQDANTEFFFSGDPNGATGTSGTKFQSFTGSYTSGDGDDFIHISASGTGGKYGGLKEGAEIKTGAGADTVIFSTQHGMGGAIIDTGQDAGDSVTIRVEQNRLGRTMDARSDRGDNEIISTDVNLIYANKCYDGLTGSVIYSSGTTAEARSNSVDAANNILIEYTIPEDFNDSVYGTSGEKYIAGFLMESGGRSTNTFKSGNDTELNLNQGFDVSANYGVKHTSVTLGGISVMGEAGFNEIISGNDTNYTADVNSRLRHNGVGGLTLETDFIRMLGKAYEGSERSANSITSGNDTTIDVSNQFEIAFSIVNALPDTAKISITNNVLSSRYYGDNFITSGHDTNITGTFENIFDMNLRKPHEARAMFVSAGMSAETWGSTNQIDSGNDTNLTITHINYEENTDTSTAYGMRAVYTSSNKRPGNVVENSIASGGKTTINVTAQGSVDTVADNVFGLYASAPNLTMLNPNDTSYAKNTITSDETEITLATNTGSAYGMVASYGGENIIQSRANTALSLIITAKGAKESYSMMAGEGVNQIIGQSQSGAPGDTVQLIGDLLATGSDGLNSIVTGDGNDKITIKGGITTKDGGVTEIKTGAGDDILLIQGKIDGELTIDMGEGGNDVLILTAPTASDFKEWYGGWLEGLDGETLKSMNVESIKFEGMGNWDTFITENDYIQEFVDLADNSGITVMFGDEELAPVDSDSLITEDFSVYNASLEPSADQVDDQADGVHGEAGIVSGQESAFLDAVLADSDVPDVGVRSLADLDGNLVLFGEGSNESLIVDAEHFFSLHGSNASNMGLASAFEDLILDFPNTAEGEDALLSEFLNSSAAGEGGVPASLVETTVDNSASITDVGFAYDVWSGHEAEEALMLAQKEVLSITGN